MERSMKGTAARLTALAERIRREAENVSPIDGHSKGEGGSAPLMRQWARTVDDIAATVGGK